MQETKIGNTNALKYKNEKTLKEGIDKYFAECDEKEKPYTMSGLAYSLGIDRATLVRYSDRDLFATQIKEAKQRVQAQLEENALTGKGNAVFTIFNLKNNYGWKDNIEVNNNNQLDKLDEILENIKGEANK